MDRVTKTSKIKEYLLNNGSITPWKALQLCNEMRLSAVIFNLKKRYGMNISSKMIYKENGERYALYTLEREG